MKKKVLIIGIDSATFDIMTPMMEKGGLPNLSRLVRKGSWGRLQSTMPPVTPPAWVSFMTGKNPGKHGVFDFYVSPSYGYIRPVWNSKYIKTKTIWRILSDNGLKVGVINLPMTHPPEEINGFIIPGMQYSLDEERNFSHPPEIMQEICKRFGEYRVLYGDLESLYTNNMDNLIEEWRKIFEIRKQSILYLMEHKDWDVFMAVFYSIDVMQHHFWKFFDKTHPQYDASISQKYENIIPEFYGKIDEAIGEMLKNIDDNTTVIVVSDHGAGPEKGAFYTNNWLYKEGFLTFKEIFSPLWRIKFPHIFYKALKRLGFPGIAWTIPLNKLKTLSQFTDPREGLSIPFFIDWKKTKAYAGNHTEQGIYINVKGREPLGIVEKGSDYETVRESIIKKIKEVKDPVSGLPLEIECFKKEEVYNGPYIDDAPDLFVIMKGAEYVMQKELYHKGLFSLPNKSSGTHRRDGVLILKGNNTKTNFTIKNARIIDVAPTILYYLGIPVPEDTDGRVLSEAFTKEYVENNPVTYGNAVEIEVKREDGILNEEESDEIKKSLRNLGYF
jgi:predicted AlkP superfamily phosphohydrolase/phosphomutase